MRTVRLGLGLLLVALVVIAVLLRGPLAPNVQAQESGDTCALLAENTVNEALSACQGLAPGEICLGSSGASAAASGDGTVLTAGGSKPTLNDVQSLTTMAADAAAGQWGLAQVMLPAGLPEGSAVTAALFGDAQIARPVVVETERSTVPVYNRGSAPINLRNGAGVTYEMVGQLEAGQETVADGRNEQADWVRIQFGDGVAWVFVPLIGWEGDNSVLNALEVLLPNDVTPSSQASGAPFEAFTLTTGAAGCEAAPSGLLLQYTGEQAAVLHINQVQLEFSNATLLLTASANGNLDVKALAGSAAIMARGISQTVSVGESVRVSLGGADGLTPAAAPAAQGTYAFADVAYMPFGLLPNAMTCMVGLPSGTDVQLRVGPGEQRGSLSWMDANRAYSVIGWSADPEGNPWWQLDTEDQPSWVDQSLVRAIGTCDGVAQVEPPPLTFAPPPAPPAGEGGEVVAGDDFAPATNSVWQMKPGTDNMSGTCTGAPAINFCDHLAAIAPASGGITWRGMEASAYYLQRIQPNVYAYSGPNILGTGTINLTLTFTGDGSLKMTMGLVLRNEPDCQHVYYYTGTKNW